MPRHALAGGSPRATCARAHAGVCPRQCLGGVNSRADGGRDELGVGVPVGWILNTKCYFLYPLQRQKGHPCLISGGMTDHLSGHA